MSLPRQDLRVYFDAEMYEAIEFFAQRDGLTAIKFVELLVSQSVRSRVHEAHEITENTKHLTIFAVSTRDNTA